MNPQSISTKTIVEKLAAECCTVSPAFDLSKAKAEPKAKEGTDQSWVHFLPFGTFYRQIFASEFRAVLERSRPPIPPRVERRT